MTLKELLKNILPSPLVLYLNKLRANYLSPTSKLYQDWECRLYAAPSPAAVKQAVLLRNSCKDSVWIETGTFLGETTLFLSKNSNFVYSIEPEPSLYKNAKYRFSKNDKIEIIHGLSEEVFPSLLPKLNGNVNFWLDGHFSEGITHKGPQDTPIVDELTAISNNLFHLDKAVIIIDDIRCFNPSIPEYSTYPSIDFLVDWARSNHLKWHIEHDMFIAKN